jgi:hypothetical protein
MLNSVDLFIGFMVFLLGYGSYLKIWEKSKTTIIVFIIITISAIIGKKDIDIMLMFISLCMLLLFLRAVFRKKFQTEQWRNIFYA